MAGRDDNVVAKALMIAYVVVGPCEWAGVAALLPSVMRTMKRDWPDLERLIWLRYGCRMPMDKVAARMHYSTSILRRIMAGAAADLMPTMAICNIAQGVTAGAEPVKGAADGPAAVAAAPGP